jgi:hypothetical protein
MQIMIGSSPVLKIYRRYSTPFPFQYNKKNFVNYSSSKTNNSPPALSDTARLASSCW